MLKVRCVLYWSVQFIGWLVRPEHARDSVRQVCLNARTRFKGLSHRLELLCKATRLLL